MSLLQPKIPLSALTRTEAAKTALRLMDPVFEARLAGSRVIAQNERALAQLRTEIARVRISDDLARIVATSCPDLHDAPSFLRSILMPELVELPGLASPARGSCFTVLGLAADPFVTREWGWG
jgi:hypothetical protein